MKIDEVTELEEAPVSAIKQKAQSIGSRVLNKVGAKGTAANLAGKADYGATANKIYQQFNAYLGTQDKNIKQATGIDLDTFLKSKKVTRNDIPNGVLQKNQINAILQDVAKQALQKQQGTASSPTSADAGTDTKATKQTSKDTPTGEKPRIPADLLKKLTALSPEEKKQLASIL